MFFKDLKGAKEKDEVDGSQKTLNLPETQAVVNGQLMCRVTFTIHAIHQKHNTFTLEQ